MDYITLNNGTKAPLCGIGTFMMQPDAAEEAVYNALMCGYRLIDTANAYMNEKAVGRGMKRSGVAREEIYLSTKLWPSVYGDADNAIDQTLHRLGTDYIDFYFVHWPDVKTPVEETMEAMNVLKKQGKVRFVGLSNFDEEQIMQCDKVCKIDVIQPPYSMVARRDENLMKWSVARGIDTFTYGSLGAGILTGAFRTPPTFGQGDPRNGFYPFFVEPHFSKVMKVLDVMDKISEETGKPLAQIAVNWSTQKDFVSTALVGVRDPQQARENCAAFEWTLTDDQIARIDAAIEANLDFDGATLRR